jgi:hypothetical protein
MARIELEADQRVRHAVAVFVDLDVIVDMNCHRLDARELIGLDRQRLQCWRILIIWRVIPRIPAMTSDPDQAHGRWL